MTKLSAEFSLTGNQEEDKGKSARKYQKGVIQLGQKKT